MEKGHPTRSRRSAVPRASSRRRSRRAQSNGLAHSIIFGDDATAAARRRSQFHRERREDGRRRDPRRPRHQSALSWSIPSVYERPEVPPRQRGAVTRPSGRWFGTPFAATEKVAPVEAPDPPAAAPGARTSRGRWCREQRGRRVRRTRLGSVASGDAAARRARRPRPAPGGGGAAP